jgi:hypothetical protein
LSEQTPAPAADQTDAQPAAESTDKPKRTYTRKAPVERARDAREQAKKKFQAIDEKYKSLVAETTDLARKHEAARQDYAYKAANPLLAGDDVEAVPQPLQIQSALVGADVPTGIKSTPVAAETLVGSDGQGASQSSDLLSEDYDADAQADSGDALDRDQPSTHQV